MEALSAHDFAHKNGQTTHYYEGGSKDGTPLIFIHGWPDIAESWKHQLLHFSEGSKYRVIAPDMRGYGDSSAPKDKRGYSLEVLVSELVELAAALNIKKAVWIGHDWGSGVVSSLAAHHPELFLGLVVLAVPYRTIELGLTHLVSLVNRDLYPASEYEWGQWEYQRHYELDSASDITLFDTHIEKITKILYTPHDPSSWGKPAATSRVIQDGGWFAGHPELLPDIPLEATYLDASLYANFLRSHKKHGFFPPTAYYLNHDANEAYAQKEVNDGVLGFPVLYVDAKFDAVCSSSTTPRIDEPQREKVKDLTKVVVESGHWVQLEKPAEVNEVVGRWLAEKV